MVTWSNGFPGGPFPQHRSGDTIVQSYIVPGALQPQSSGPTVLSYTNALLGIPYPQHKSGQTKVQSYIFPGAVQPSQNRIWQGSAVFVGAGNLSVTAPHVLAAFATFPGASSLSVTGDLFRGSATFTGTGSLAAIISQGYGTNPASFTGAGSLSVTASFGLAAVAAFSGVGSFKISGSLFRTGEVLAGVGSLAVSTLQIIHVGVAFSGSGNLSAVLSPPTILLEANVTGSGGLCAQARVRKGRRGLAINVNVSGRGVTTNIVITGRS